MSQSRRRTVWKGMSILLALFAIGAILALSAGPASAKKPPKPPPEPEMTNPALLYRGIFGKDGQYVITADGSQTELVVKNAKGGVPLGGQWSPDGTMIAYQWQMGARRVYTYDFYVANADGSQPVLVDSNGPLSRGDSWAWSPDGTRIFYSISSSIWAFDLLDGPEQLVLDTGLWGLSGLCFSPDLDPDTGGYQGYLAFSGYDPEGRLTIGYDIVLLEVSIDGIGTIGTGEPTYIPLEGTRRVPRVWSPDGHFLAYGDGTAGPGWVMGLVVEEIEGQQVVTVTDHWSLGFPVAAWSPDGQYVAFIQWGPFDPSGAYIDAYRADFVVEDGTPRLTNIVNLTNTKNQREVHLDWNPLWVNDLGP